MYRRVWGHGQLSNNNKKNECLVSFLLFSFASMPNSYDLEKSCMPVCLKEFQNAAPIVKQVISYQQETRFADL